MYNASPAMLYHHCDPPTLPIPAPPHPVVCAGLLVVTWLSVQAAYSLKQNEILLWNVLCPLESLQLFSDALKLFKKYPVLVFRSPTAVIHQVEGNSTRAKAR